MLIDERIYGIEKEPVQNWDLGCEYKGVAVARSILEQGGRNYLIYGDPDIDGMCATYIAYRWCMLQGCTPKYYVNGNRQHGFLLNKDVNIEGYTIIAVDFSMTREELKAVISRGANIVLLDHHHIEGGIIVEKNEEKGTRGIIINNQYSFEEDSTRFYSGAGVTYQVLSAIDGRLKCEDNVALVGLSLLSDVRDIENPKARGILDVTYHCRTPFFQRLVNCTRPQITYGFGVVRMDRQYIDYTFSPKINALFRANKGFEAIEFLLGVDVSAELLNTCREWQNGVLQYILEHLKIIEYKSFILGCIEEEPMQELEKKIPVDLKGYNIRSSKMANYIGVACSRLKGFRQKSVLLCVTKGERIVRGSFRGQMENAHYLDAVQYLGVEAEGHQQAFGVTSLRGVDLSKMDALLDGLEQYTGKETDMSKTVLPVQNLGLLCRLGYLAMLSYYNEYTLSQNMVGIKYTGANYKVKPLGKCFEWDIDGVKVRAFSEEINPKNGYIVPIRDRDITVLYLRQTIS